jgi:hypothetical protein
VASRKFLLNGWIPYLTIADRGFNFNDFRWSNAPSGARRCILSIDDYSAKDKSRLFGFSSEEPFEYWQMKF